MTQITESLIHSQNQLGEGPLWHAQEQALYWVDIHQKRVERYTLADGTRRTTQFETAVTALGLREAGGFVVSTADGLGLWDGTSDQVKVLARPEAALPLNRFNDGAVGPAGRFWAGSMQEDLPAGQPATGSLYSLDAAGEVRKKESDLFISNGLGWSPDKRKMYLTDSTRRTIYQYDYDPASGEIGKRIPLIHTPDEPGVPDGLAVDGEGCIWSARWGGWKVTRYDPAGKPMSELTLPVEHPTSCAFGGPDLNLLFITSAWTPLDAAARKEQPLAGDVFCVEVGVRGQGVYHYQK